MSGQAPLEGRDLEQRFGPLGPGLESPLPA
jgi:hypothetical protein